MTETQLWLAAEHISQRADSEQHARMAMAYLLDSLSSGNDEPLLESIDRRRESLLEAAASTARQVGDVWQGASGRWFTKNQSGRVVPTKKPQGETAGGDKGGKVEAKPAPAASAKATPAAKATPKVPAAKKTATPKQATATLDDVKAQLTAMQQGQGDPEGLMGALLGLGLADIRKLRDEYKGAGGGRSKNDVAQRLIDKVKADLAAEKAAKEQPTMKPVEPEPEAKPTAPEPEPQQEPTASQPAEPEPAPPAPAKDDLPPVPKGKTVSSEMPEQGLRVVTDDRGEGKTTLTRPSPEIVERLKDGLSLALKTGFMYQESQGGLMPLHLFAELVRRGSGRDTSLGDIYSALDQLYKNHGIEMQVLNEVHVLTDPKKYANSIIAKPVQDTQNPDLATFWKNDRAMHFIHLPRGVTADAAIEAGMGGKPAGGSQPAPVTKPAPTPAAKPAAKPAARPEPAPAPAARPVPAAAPAPASAPVSKAPPPPTGPIQQASTGGSLVKAGQKVTDATIGDIWDKLPGAKDNLVSLADLQDALGVNTATMHHLVNRLRKERILSGVNHEGRAGTQAEKDRLLKHSIADGQNAIAYVSLNDI